MAKLNIELVADAQKALGGLNQTTESASKLFNQLVKGKDVSEQFSQALGRDLAVAADKAGGGLKSMEAQLRELLKYQEKARLAFGDFSDEFTTLSDAVSTAREEIARMKAVNEKAAESMRKHQEALAEAARAADDFGKAFSYNEREALEYAKRVNAELEEQRRNIQEVNSKNANVGFMMLTGDKMGVANYALREYEQTLKQVIAETGINSKETQKALAVYQKQAKYVSILNDSTKKLNASTQGYNATKKQTIRVEESHSNKLLSVAKNILKFQLLMGPITSAIRGIKQFVSESTVAAAEAEQTFSKLATVFDTVSDSARKMAENLAQTIGVSKSTAAGALSTVGDLLQAQGMGTAQSLATSSEWVSQFQDIIAFKDLNMSLEEFAQNFMSGAAGNLRNFRTFGSIVKESAVNARLAAQGLDQLTGSELELAKMTARAEIALEQQANAMGATEREWDTMLSVNRRMTEAQKELKENFGSWLNTALKPIKTVWTEILDTINDAVAASRQLPQFAQNMASATPSVLFSRSENADLWERNSRSLVGGFANYFGMMSEEIASNKDLDKIYDYDATLNETAQKIARMFVSFGLTVEEGLSAFEEDWQTVQALEDDYFGDIDIRGELHRRVKSFTQMVDDALGAEGNTNSLAEAIDRISNVYENLAAISGVSVKDALDAFNRHSGKLSGDTQSAFDFSMQQLQGNLQLGFKEALDSLSGADWKTFFTRSQLDFGEGTETGGLSAKIESLKAIYTVIQNASDIDEEKREEYLNRVLKIYGNVLDRQKEINDEIERQSKFASALSSLSSTGSGYGLQLAQLRMTDDEKALDNLNRQYIEAYALAATAEEQKQVNDAYQEAEKTLKDLLSEQRKYNNELAREKGLKAANSSITEARKAGARSAYERGLSGTSYNNAYAMEMWDINNQVFDFVRELTASGYTFKEATDKAREYREVLEANAEATRKAAEAGVKLQAWKALGNRALGSTGTMGGVIQALTSEEGDTWTKILNAILTILENTEGWEKVSAMLDQVFAAFVPVVDAIIDLLESLPWDIIIFCVKVIASVIVIIAKFFEQLFNVFDWLWTNIKTAFHNLGEIIRHPMNKGARDTWGWYSWDELQTKMEATAEKEVNLLTKIWGCAWSIDSKMNDNKDLKVLEDLWKRRIISTQQYYREAGSLQGYYNASPATIDPSHYAGSQVSISRGNVILNIYTNNPQEIRKELERWATEEGYSTSGTSLVGGY